MGLCSIEHSAWWEEGDEDACIDAVDATGLAEGDGSALRAVPRAGLAGGAELPGVEQKDIAISLQDGVLTIKGETRAEKEEKDICCSPPSRAALRVLEKAERACPVSASLATPHPTRAGDRNEPRMTASIRRILHATDFSPAKASAS